MMVGLERVRKLPRTETDRVGEVVFANGSTLRVTVAGATDRTASKKGRGRALERMHGTEVSHWGAAQTTLDAAREAVRDGGQIVLESTAYGASGAFYDQWQRADASSNAYTRHFLPWWWHREYRALVPVGFDAAPRDQHESAMRDLGLDDEQIAWWRAKVAERPDVDSLLAGVPVLGGGGVPRERRELLDGATCDWLEAQARDPLRVVELAARTGATSGSCASTTSPPRRALPRGRRRGGRPGPDGDASAWDVISRRTGLTVATWWSDRHEPADMALAGAEIGRLYNGALLAPGGTRTARPSSRRCSGRRSTRSSTITTTSVRAGPRTRDAAAALRRAG